MNGTKTLVVQTRDVSGYSEAMIEAVLAAYPKLDSQGNWGMGTYGGSYTMAYQIIDGQLIFLMSTFDEESTRGILDSITDIKIQ